MKNDIKLFWLSLFFLLLGFTAIAQKRSFSISPTIGINFPLLDKGLGFHISLNTAYTLSSRFTIESQLSYAFMEIDGKRIFCTRI